MKMFKCKIKGLDCANCANELEGALNKIDIIDNVNISFMAERLTFECNESDRDIAFDEIRRVIKKEEPDVTIEEV